MHIKWKLAPYTTRKKNKKHMFDLIMTSKDILMTVNDLEMKTSELFLYGYQIKAANPYNLNIGKKHKFDLIIASNNL